MFARTLVAIWLPQHNNTAYKTQTQTNEICHIPWTSLSQLEYQPLKVKQNKISGCVTKPHEIHYINRSVIRQPETSATQPTGEFGQATRQACSNKLGWDPRSYPSAAKSARGKPPWSACQDKWSSSANESEHAEEFSHGPNRTLVRQFEMANVQQKGPTGTNSPHVTFSRIFLRSAQQNLSK